MHGLDPAHAEELECLGRDHEGLLDALERLDPLLETAVAAFAAGFEELRATFAAHEQREEALTARLGGAWLAR